MAQEGWLVVRLLFFNTLPHSQQQAVNTTAAAGRPHPVQAWPELEGDAAVMVMAVTAVVAWQRRRSWDARLATSGPSSEDTPDDVAGGLPE
ncbi:hypothetical protein PI125_g8753 [Phytophthora idaei]|nr:hypothetical protein PI125_g8753 [Phytophthora idaei]KAG3159935.1 hypothetical protein PI126_g7157 [Phytophthora idaei]